MTRKQSLYKLSHMDLLQLLLCLARQGAKKADDEITSEKFRKTFKRKSKTRGQTL